MWSLGHCWRSISLRLTDGAQPMEIFTFAVDDFIIHDTRSPHNDTLSLYYSAYLNGDLVKSRVIALGDFDNGEYSVIDYVPSDIGPGIAVVVNDPDAKVAFNFQLVNSSTPLNAWLQGNLASAAQALASFATGIKGAG